jgi:hypothetical protein
MPHCLSAVYSVTIPLHVSDFLAAHHHEVTISQNLCHKLFLGIPHPHLNKKNSYQNGSKSEQVPRYPLLCRNPRNAVINISAE